MNKSQTFLSIYEERVVTVALHDPGYFSKEDGYYSNAHILGFELWDVPYSDSTIAGSKLAKNYIGLFNNLYHLNKKEIRKKFNLTKQRISIERSRAERVFIPDSVWNKLKISHPRSDQKLFLQSLFILYKSHNVRLAGMEDMNKIEHIWY